MKKLVLFLAIMLFAFTTSYAVDKKVELQENVGYPSSSMNSRATILAEDFSGGVLPAGWQNVDNAGLGEVWYFDNPGTRTINTSTSANGFAIFDADYNGSAGGAEDCDLITPIIDCSGTSNLHLEFEHYFWQYSAAQGEVLVSGNNGGSWTSIDAFIATTANAQSESYDISAIAADSSQVLVKFNYTGSWDWLWAIDDVRIYEQDPYDVSLTKLTADESISIGESFDYFVSINNKGANNDTYDLALSGGTWYSIYDKDDTGVITSIAINAGVVDTVLVKVNVPGTAVHDDTDAVNLTVTSQGDPGVSAVTAAPITTTAVDPTSVPYTEDFETNLDDWVLIQDAVTSVSITTDAVRSGTYGCEIADVDPDDGYYGAGYLTQYFDPMTNPLVTLWYKFDTSSIYNTVYIQFYTATDGWLQLTDTSSPTDWNEAVLDLTDYDTESASWRVRLIAQPYSGVSCYLDDISIESVAIPTIASDPVPAIAAINVDITPTLSWTNNYPVIDSTVVWFGDSMSDAFAPVDTLYGATSSYTYTGTLNYLTPYYWKVVNYNVAGNNGTTATQWSFTTVGSVPQVPINPVPADVATEVELLPALSWESTNADSFLVFYKAPGWISHALLDTVFTNSYTFTTALDYNSVYSWYVKAGNENGEVQSATWSFTTIVPETFPFAEDFEGVVSAWAMGGTNSSWEIDVPTGLGTVDATYFADPVADHSDPGTKCAGTDITVDGDYNASEASQLTSPPIDCTLQSTVLLEFWRVLNCENSYDEAYVEVTNDGGVTWSDLGHPVYVQDDAWTEVSLNATAYAAGETVQFRWRIAGDSSVQKSGWNIDDISVNILPVPTAATDPVPVDSAIDVSIIPTLSWTNNGAVDSTIVWIDAAIVDTLYSGNSYTTDQLDFSTAYTWKVVSYNASGNTVATAATWSFTTMSADPVNLSPADTETLCFEYQMFTWDAIAGVDSYNIYIGTTVHGSDIVNGENVTTNSYENTVALPLGDTYYWYVESDIAAVRTVVGTSADFSFDTAPVDYYTEGFEGATFPPDGWVNDSWTRTIYTRHTQTNSVYRYGYSALTDTLITSRLDLSGGTGTEEMSFYWKSASSYDTDSLVVVFNNGTTLETLDILKGVDADWHKATYTLTSMSDDCYVEFRFLSPASSGDSYYIDDVVLPPRWFPAISFTLAPSTQSDAGVPGTSITYDYTIENTGGASDTYDVTFGTADNWITGVSANPITVASGTTEILQITVAIPALAPVDVAHADTLIVTSQTLGTVTSSATAITSPHIYDNQEPNDDFANATIVSPSRAMSWTSDATSEVFPEDDLDFYQFTATAGNVVTLTQVVDGLSSLDGEIALYNYASADSLIMNVDSSGSGSDEQIVYTIPVTGTYYVVHAYYADLPLPTARDARSNGIAGTEKGKPELDSRANSGKYSFTFLEQSPAVISVTTASISETVEFNQTGTELLNVANTGDADLNYSAITSGTVPYNLLEGFESGIPAGWAVYNEDGDTKEFVAGSSSYNAHTGLGYVSVGYNGSGNDDWLVTPQITVGAGETFAFWAKSGSSSWLEDFEVWISTTGNAVADFTISLGGETDVATTWTQYPYDLSAYDGDDVYLAIRCVSVDDLTFYVDDVTVGTAASAPPTWLSLVDGSGTVAGSMNADITLNFDSAGLAAGTYNANVIVASNGGADVTVPVAFTVNAFAATAPTLTITESGGDVILTWNDVFAASYYIYTSTDPYTGYTIDAQVDGNTFTKTYYGIAVDKLFYQVTSSDDAYAPPVRDSGSRARK